MTLGNGWCHSDQTRRIGESNGSKRHQRFLAHPWPACSGLRLHLLKDSNDRLRHLLPNPLAAADGEN